MQTTMLTALDRALGIIAAQQGQISRLERRLDAAVLGDLQLRISEQSSVHLRGALDDAGKQLKALGAPQGEVSVGMVTHKGSIEVKRSSTAKVSASARVETSKSASSKVDISGELKGLMKLLAGVSLNVKVDTSATDKRIEELEQSSEHADSESIEGNFEVTHQGISIKIGK